MFGAKQVLSRVRFGEISTIQCLTRSQQFLQFQTLIPSGIRFAHNNSLQHAMNNPDVSRILSFWYDRPAQQWFMPPEGFDDECKSNFGPLVLAARNKELDDWTSEPKSTLALLILLDQFPRNIFRGTPDAFATDLTAQAIATKSIAKGYDKQVTFYQATNYYLPLMHAENLLAQVAVVAMYENLHNRCPEDSEEKEFLSRSAAFAKNHLSVILQFGRFPSRNKILGRESTKEEEEFLKEHPHGF